MSYFTPVSPSVLQRVRRRKIEGYIQTEEERQRRRDRGGKAEEERRRRKG